MGIGQPVFPFDTINEPGGSGSGVSYYSQFAACPKKGHLAQEMRGGEIAPHFLVGTFLHSLLEHYYTVPDFSVKAFRQAGEGKLTDPQLRAYNDAEKLFREYRLTFRPDEFEVVGAEVPVGNNDAVHEALGISPFTAKIDLVVKPANVNPARNVVLEPGQTYLVDHKTTGRLTSTLELQFRHRYQFIAYMVAYAAHTGIKPAGMLVNIINKNPRQERFKTLLLPYPDVEQIKAVKHFLKIAHARANGPAIAIPTDENCFGPYGACEFLQNGMCKRY